jgi:hypothetical protein
MVADLVFDAAVGVCDDDADGTTVVEPKREAVAYELGWDRLGAEVDAPFEALQPWNRHPVGRGGLMPVEPIVHAVKQLATTAQLADARAFLDLRAQRNPSLWNHEGHEVHEERWAFVSLVCFMVHVLSSASRTLTISSCFENGFGRKTPVGVTDARSNRSCSA